MIVVSDTSPLNYLLLIGQFDVLPALFDRIIAPQAVIDELLDAAAPKAVRTCAGPPLTWLEVIRPIRAFRSRRVGSNLARHRTQR